MISVVGCGRVGLPLALCLASRGESVLGVDVNRSIVEAVGKGEMPFTDGFAEPLLAQTLGRNFGITIDLERAARSCDKFVLALGTPLGPHMLPEQAGLAAVVERLLELTLPQRGGAEGRVPPTILIRSTVTPGSTDGLIRLAERRFGARMGEDFLIAFCPERTLEGDSHELLELPQIIGARDQRSAEAAASLFGLLGVDIITTGIVEAELAKLFDNAYRYVNFALSNELMIISRLFGANIFEALRAANEGYKRGGIPAPGFAGGPCLYKDGFLLNSRVPMVDLLLASWRLNESLPEYFIQQVELLRPLSKVAVLGLAFKADSNDVRNSLGLKILDILANRGVEAMAHDPGVDWPGATKELGRALDGAGEVFVIVPHRQYRELPWEELARRVRPDCVIADPWRVWGQDDVVTRFDRGPRGRRPACPLPPPAR